jgi:hypothetical protein
VEGLSDEYPFEGPLQVPWKDVAVFSFAAAVHFATFVVLFFHRDVLNARPDEEFKVDRRAIVISFDDAAALREDTPFADDETGQLYENGTGMSADGEAGSTGDNEALAIARALSFVGVPDSTPVSASPHRGPSDDTCWGPGISDSAWRQPWVAWSSGASGNDKSAWGNIVDNVMADAFGSPGLDSAGTESGGGHASQRGFGHLDTLKTDANQTLGVAIDIGSHSLLPEKSVRPGSIDAQASTEAVQRTIERSYGRFRSCYEAGVRKDPLLAGNVRVRFAIGTDGSTFDVGEEGSSLGDADVIGCVLGVFRTMSFPPPSAGMVRVTYPVVLTRSVR